MKRLMLFGFAVCLFSTALYAQLQQPSENDFMKGFTPDGSYLTENDEEYVSMSNGAVIIKHTDLVLPGRNGLDLVLQRTYPQKSNNFCFYIPVSIPLLYQSHLYKVKAQLKD